MEANLAARLERRAHYSAGANRLALRLAALWLRSRYPARDTQALTAPWQAGRPDGETLPSSFERPGRHLTDRAEGVSLAGDMLAQIQQLHNHLIDARAGR